MTLVESIVAITNTFGAEILRDTNRFCAILGDMAPTLNKERKILRRAKDENVFPLILEAYYADAIKRNSLLSKVEYVLRTEAGFSDEWISVIIGSFSEAFCWNSSVIKENKEIPSNLGPPKEHLKCLTKQDVKSQFARVPYDFVIPNGYSIICEKAFTYKNLKQVHSIIIPDSVVDIQCRAFYSIKVNGYVEIPKTVASIGENAFNLAEGAYIKCDKDSYAYEYCSMHGINNSVDLVPDGTRIDRIRADLIPAQLSTDECFYELLVPKGTISIEKGAFRNRDDFEMILSDNNLKYIKTEAFKDCKSLKFAVIGSLLGIASNAFNGCSNLEIVFLNLADADTKSEQFNISKSAFSACPKLQVIISDGYCVYLEKYSHELGITYTYWDKDTMHKDLTHDQFWNFMGMMGEWSHVDLLPWEVDQQ